MRSKMITGLLPVALLAGLFLCCDDFKDEDYVLSDLDRAVIDIMQDSLLVIEVGLEGLAQYDTAWTGTNINASVGAIIDTLEVYGQQLMVKDSCYEIDIASDDSSYFYIEAGVEGEYVFCFNEPVIFELIDGTGMVLENQSTSRSTEEVTGGVTYYTDEALKVTLIYYISVKNAYELTPGRYLGRIIKTDMLEETVINAVIQVEQEG